MADRPPSSLLRQTIHTFGTLVFTTGAQIALGIATARAFGPVGKGIIGFAAILLTFAVTTGQGLCNAIAFQVGREQRSRQSVWGAALATMAVLGPLGLLAFMLAWRLLPSQPAYFFVALAFSFALYSQVVSIIYQLSQRIERINIQNMATTGVGYALVALGLVTLLHVDVAVVLWVWVCAYVVAAIWNSFGVNAMIGGAPRQAEPELVRSQLWFGAKAAVSSNLTFLALRVDIFVVSIMLAPAALGIYSLALATGETMWLASRSIFWSASGRMATAPFEESAALTCRIVRSILAVLVIGSVLAFAAGPWLIVHVYGMRFVESGGVLRIVLPRMICYGADGVLSYFIAVRAGRPALLLGLEATWLAICGITSILAVRPLGIVGVAIAGTLTFVIAFAIKSAIFIRITRSSVWDLLIPRTTDIPHSLSSRLTKLWPSRASSER